MNLGNSASDPYGYAIYMGHCPTDERVINNNDFWQISGNRYLSSPGSCAAQSGQFNDASLYINPYLDANFRPSAEAPPGSGYNNLVCDLGTTTLYTAPDGDVPSSYIGAKPCSEAGGGGGSCHPFCYQD